MVGTHIDALLGTVVIDIGVIRRRIKIEQFKKRVISAIA
jgi:hypothetical protein